MLKQPNLTSTPCIPPIAIIVAMTKDRVIGSNKAIPWHLPEDLQLFKHLTMGCTILMGKRTYESIGHPLPGRHNIVLSRSLKELPGVQVCNSFISGLTAAAQHGRPVFVIGGEELYRKALPIASGLHISWVEATISGDVYFPELDLADWVICEKSPFPGFCYVHYHRKENHRAGLRD